jgi:hypothetical protein
METLGPPYKTILCRVFETLYHPPRHFSQLSRCCDCETALRIMWCISLRYGRQRTARQAQLLSLWAQRRQSNKASDSARVYTRVTRPVSSLPPGLPNLTVYNRLVICAFRGIIRGAMDEHSNLLRLLCGQLHSLLVLTVAREKFGKGFLELSEQQSNDAVASAESLTRFFAIQMTPERVQKMLEPNPPEQIQ